MIPIPRSGQFSLGNRNTASVMDSKFAKTEKNRLRVIMQTRPDNEDKGEDAEEKYGVDESDVPTANENFVRKEQKIGMDFKDGSSKKTAKTKNMIPRYRAKVILYSFIIIGSRVCVCASCVYVCLCVFCTLVYPITA